MKIFQSCLGKIETRWRRDNENFSNAKKIANAFWWVVQNNANFEKKKKIEYEKSALIEAKYEKKSMRVTCFKHFRPALAKPFLPYSMLYSTHYAPNTFIFMKHSERYFVSHFHQAAILSIWTVFIFAYRFNFFFKCTPIQTRIFWTNIFLNFHSVALLINRYYYQFWTFWMFLIDVPPSKQDFSLPRIFEFA